MQDVTLEIHVMSKYAFCLKQPTTAFSPFGTFLKACKKKDGNIVSTLSGLMLIAKIERRHLLIYE